MLQLLQGSAVTVAGVVAITFSQLLATNSITTSSTGQWHAATNKCATLPRTLSYCRRRDGVDQDAG
jgi:hypothetical protein